MSLKPAGINMNMRITRILTLSFLLVLLSACSGKFESGEKVWIDLPGKSLLKDGYAVGQVIEYKDRMVHVQVLKVQATNKHELLPVLRIGQAYVPRDSLRPYQEGKSRFEEKQRAVARLNSLVSKGASARDKAFTDIARVADKYDIAELKQYVALYRLRDKYLSHTLPLEKRIRNIPAAIDGLKDLLDRNKAARAYLIDWSMSHYRKVLDREAKKLGFDSHLQPKQLAEPDLFAKGLMAFTRDIQMMINQSVSDKDEIAGIIKYLDAVDDAEKALLVFVTRDGEEMGGKATLTAVLNQKRLVRRQKLAARARGDILASIDFSRIKTRKDARKAYKKAYKQGKKLAGKLGVPVITKDDEKSYFTGPLLDRQEKARKREDRLWKKASNKKARTATQRRRLKNYLRKYPRGRHAASARKRLAGLAQIRKQRARKKARQASLIVSMLKSGQTYNGQTGYKDKTLKFIIRFSKYKHATGKFGGTIIWPSRGGAVNSIEGSYDAKKQQLRFTEKTVRKAGDWHTGDRYQFRLAGKRLLGTHKYKRYLFITKTGKASITIKP
jgi:hypothetical protein